jgi:uncharacterized protein (TIGR00645 family)
MRKLELSIEWVLFNSRWLMAPVYLGLAASLVGRVVRFLVELVQFGLAIPRASHSEVIVGLLNLIDMVFTGNLVLIVIMSGFENFVSRIEAGDDRPDWMTKVDFGGLKQKLMVSIVAISAITVLEAFMNIEHHSSEKLAWIVGIHAVFLASMLVVAWSDKLGESAMPPEERPARR